MNALIIFFSGTGNTEFIARYMKTRFSEPGSPLEDISLASIEQFPAGKLKDYSLIIFGFPVFALEAPRLVTDYIELLEDTGDKFACVFSFNTYGLAGGNANRHVLQHFSKKGFHPLGGLGVKMPGSDGLVMSGENSWYVKRAKKRDFTRLPKVDKFIHFVESRVKELEGGKSLSEFKERKPWSILGFLLGWIFGLFFRRLEKKMKKQFWVDENCVLCGICVKNCPVANIKIIEKKIVFDDRCVLCMRCLNQCPEYAIQIGKLTVGKFRWKGPAGDFHPLQYKTIDS
ncbi:MAG: EFR1 family ferrodoxin [Promethearchaeota archaeon]